MTAMVAAGVATFAQLYAVQAVLPGIAVAFDASASAAALAVSLATGGLAGFVLVWSGIADRFGRVPVMTGALVVSTLLGSAAPFAHELWLLLVLRALQGAALGGLPAVAVAYLAERIHPSDLGRAVGLYIAGNTLGGMSGRLVAGAVADLGGWRWGVGADAALGMLTLVVFYVAIPRSGSLPQSSGEGSGRGLASRLGASLRDPVLLGLYAQALLLMGAFVTVYNFLGFRLLAPPFGVSQTVVALLFTAYLAGMLSSSVAGWLVDRVGRYRVLLLAAVAMALAAAVLALPLLGLVVPGLVLFTFSFFAAHATASAWVGQRATFARAQAAALYTLAYYLGSSLFGWLGGVVYDRLGWTGMSAYVVVLCAAALLCGLPLRARR
ncbi:MFS transporter [Nocardiopsis ansamitocini]|uniref:MFS transporter n=1 Tax=Nocardiopsis ansamitocini TaxID=1670832 RepID=A0A9W6UIG6_9ACTN|nr:MFS transporter [Nocardiopsis ansamitocini]